VSTSVIPCTACGIRMVVTDRRILLCDFWDIVLRIEESSVTA